MAARPAPILPVRDLEAALGYYRKLGFDVRAWRGGGYGFVVFDGAEIHLGVEADARPVSAYLFVEDAGAVAAAWTAAGGDVGRPQDTEWGMYEGVLIDLDGNRLRFGSVSPQR